SSAINSGGTGSPSGSSSETTTADALHSSMELTPMAVSSSQINLSWAPPTDNGGSAITGYKIERSTDGGATWTVLVVNTGSATTSSEERRVAKERRDSCRGSATNKIRSGSRCSSAVTTAST